MRVSVFTNNFLNLYTVNASPVSLQRFIAKQRKRFGGQLQIKKYKGDTYLYVAFPAPYITSTAYGDKHYVSTRASLCLAVVTP